MKIKTKLQRAWIDLTRPSEWRITVWFNDIRTKIKDYERLESDYILVLANATMGAMSKSSYELETIYDTINDTQQEHYYGIVKSDITDLIKEGGCMADVEKYIKSLYVCH